MATRKSASRAKGSRDNKSDVYAVLKEDHQKVQKLFKEFERLHEQEGDSDEMRMLARQICTALTIHAQVEEELFYPELRERLEETDLLDEAKVEHDSARMLIEMIEQEDGDEEMLAARVIVLGEYVNHHIDEEHKEIFPAAKKAKIDAEALGEAVMARSEELKAEMGAEDDESEEDEDEYEDADEEEEEAQGRRAARSGDGSSRPAQR
jgi:hypothetical protein